LSLHSALIPALFPRLVAPPSGPPRRTDELFPCYFLRGLPRTSIGRGPHLLLPVFIFSNPRLLYDFPRNCSAISPSTGKVRARLDLAFVTVSLFSVKNCRCRGGPALLESCPLRVPLFRLLGLRFECAFPRSFSPPPKTTIFFFRAPREPHHRSPLISQILGLSRIPSSRDDFVFLTLCMPFSQSGPPRSVCRFNPPVVELERLCPRLPPSRRLRPILPFHGLPSAFPCAPP